MKKRIIPIVLILVAVFGIFYARNLHIPNDALKKAVKIDEITSENYILCKRERVTGFDWCTVLDENGNDQEVFCNITGIDPYDEFNFKYEFSMEYNTFIFYIDGVDLVYNEAADKETKVYNVVGWDILYPVKHEALFGFFNSKHFL